MNGQFERLGVEQARELGLTAEWYAGAVASVIGFTARAAADLAQAPSSRFIGGIFGNPQGRTFDLNEIMPTYQPRLENEEQP